MKIEDLVDLLGKRVLVKLNGTSNIVETHVWEISLNNRFVKLGSGSPHDYACGWFKPSECKLIDILPEDYYKPEQITEHLNKMKDAKQLLLKDPNIFQIIL